MRFYTSAHRFYCGVDLHARSMSDVGEPVVLTGRVERTSFLGTEIAPSQCLPRCTHLTRPT